MEKLIKNFIWGKGTPKISMNIMKGLKQNGGAGLSDLKTRAKSFCLKWVTQLKQPIFQALSEVSIDSYLGSKIWNIQLTSKHFDKLFTVRNFLWEVLRDWTRYNYNPPSNKREALKQLLWYNSNICIHGQPVFYKDWSDMNIDYINDLVEENGEFISHEKLERKMRKRVPFTVFLGIINAIPESWKRWIRNKEKVDLGEEGVDYLDQLKEKTSVSKFLYQELKGDMYLLSGKCAKLNELCKSDVSVEEMIRWIKNINLTTNCVKLHSFQYRLLLQAVITNVHLKHYKIKESNNCSFCSTTKENLKHLFYDCKYVTVVWNYVEKCYNCKLDWLQVFTNQVHAKPKHPLNTVVLIVKFYIYSTRCEGKRVNVKSCKNYIKNYIQIEEQIAKSKNRLHLHETKWSEWS